MDWREERDKFWEEFDLWDDKHAPVTKQSYVVYVIELPLKVKKSWARAMYNPFTLWVGVSEDDTLHVIEHSIWFGKMHNELPREIQRDIVDYLIEWELAEWKQIGPEEKELFATEKLTESTADERFE